MRLPAKVQTAAAINGALGRPSGWLERHAGIESRRLWGKGLGWVDCQLIASALMTGCRLWTADRALSRVCAAIW